MSDIAGVDSRLLYTALVGLVVVERLVELGISRGNERWAKARGGVEAGREHYPWMVAMHTAFLAACPLEVWLLGRPLLPALGAAMLLLLVAAMALRYWVIATLGRRWSTRVICLPGVPVITGGPFRWARHPNYLAVVVETAALPLVHTAWLTALAFSLANAALLRTRIRVEEEALSRHCHGREPLAGAALDGRYGRTR